MQNFSQMDFKKKIKHWLSTDVYDFGQTSGFPLPVSFTEKLSINNVKYNKRPSFLQSHKT